MIIQCSCINQSDLDYAIETLEMCKQDHAQGCGFNYPYFAPGGGVIERKSDIRTAFDVQNRIHEQSGKEVQIAGTSCRIVNFQTFENELRQNGLVIIKQGITVIEPDFPQMMFAVVRAG